ncbi:DUF2207 domain-containing protein, partial [Nonomuraea sp. NN258]|uniref:DUF2207 domain-containing protein n=1 Tax=Nonomuraea antri TaxID=2730852 RepID=UPI0015684CE5
MTHATLTPPVLALVLGLGTLITPGAAPAAEPAAYTLPETVVRATVAADGSVRVDEDHVFRFARAGHGAYVDVPQLDGAEVTDVTVTEGETAYRRSGTPELGVDRPADTYADDACMNGARRVVWYFAAEPETTRTFRVSYTLKRAVSVHDRHAFLHLPVWGSGWQQELGLLRVSVRLPRKAKGGNDKGGKEEYRAYGRGFRAALTRDRGGAGGSVKNVAAGQAVSLDLAFPAAQLTGADDDAVVRREGSGAAALAKLRKKVPAAGTTAPCVMAASLPTFAYDGDTYSSGGGSRSNGDPWWILWLGLLLVLVVAGMLGKGMSREGGG